MDRNQFIGILYRYYTEGINLSIVESLLIPCCIEKGYKQQEVQTLIKTLALTGALEKIVTKIIDHYEVNFSICKIYESASKNVLLKIL